MSTNMTHLELAIFTYGWLVGVMTPAMSKNLSMPRLIDFASSNDGNPNTISLITSTQQYY